MSEAAGIPEYLKLPSEKTRDGLFLAEALNRMQLQREEIKAMQAKLSGALAQLDAAEAAIRAIWLPPSH